MKLVEHIRRNRARYCIGLICSVVLILSTKGMTDESTVAMNGDMPKYLMNGAFFYDFLRDLPITNPLRYAYEYFARYPALSLGHHPVLLGLAEAPFYASLGISVFAARMTILFFVLVAVIVWFQFARLVYDEITACISALLLVTTPMFLNLSRVVMSEIPMLSFIFLATYFFYRYCQEERPRYAYAFAISFVLSVYAKQTAIYMLPVYLLYFLFIKGFRKFLIKDVIIACLIIALLIIPIIPMTLKFSQYNVSWTMHKIQNVRIMGPYRHLHLLTLIVKAVSSLPIVLMTFASLFISIYRRDKRVLFFLLWLIVLYLEFAYSGAPTPRHAILLAPLFFLLAAGTVSLVHHRVWKLVLSSILIVIIGYQLVSGLQEAPETAKGYEDAAKYVTAHMKGGCVLYGGVYDTGYFIFFSRKHDPNKDMVILRADKILATSYMNHVIEDRIGRPEDIYEILKKYGVRYVLVEDARAKSQSLEWLKEEVKSDKFHLRKEIIIQSNNPKVNNMPLRIYEFRNYTRPRKGQVLEMKIPLMGGSITIPFDDLLHSQ